MKTMRVRPVLVETSEKSRICHLSPKGIEYKDLRFLEIECPIILDSINYDIILISLDDCAKVGDMYYDEHNNLVLKATEYTDHKVYLYKKVIANQRQFSDELTEKLVEEYNNGDMSDFVIEMNVVTMCQSSLKYDNDDILVNDEIVDSFHCSLFDLIDETIEKYNKPRLTNGYITPIGNSEIQKPLNDYINQKHNQDRCIGFIDGYETRQFGTKEGYVIRNTNSPYYKYSEEDVLKLLIDFKNHIGLYRGIQVLDSDIQNWFELIKKK